MANTTQDALFEAFVEIAGDQVSNLGEIVNTGEELASALGDIVKQIHTTQVTAVESAAAVAKTAAAETTSNGGSGMLDAIGSIASAVAKNALGATPLIRGILSLFGGDDDSGAAPQSYTKFRLPPSIGFLAADTPGGFSATGFDQTGFQRQLDPASNVTMAGALLAPPSTPAGQQITVNVQAMDARSFLDRSDDIAAAVRSAMLNLNSINDVVSDL